MEEENYILGIITLLEKKYSKEEAIENFKLILKSYMSFDKNIILHNVSYKVNKETIQFFSYFVKYIMSVEIKEPQFIEKVFKKFGLIEITSYYKEAIIDVISNYKLTKTSESILKGYDWQIAVIDKELDNFSSSNDKYEINFQFNTLKNNSYKESKLITMNTFEFQEIHNSLKSVLTQLKSFK